MRPILRQAGDLTAEDFGAHPVWVHCHIVDYEESWYDDTDEETFRPWDGVLPVVPSHAIFLLAAQVVFADCSSHAGYITPSEAPDDLAAMQPHVFVGGESYAFWGGIPGVPEATRASFYRAAGDADRLFPIRYSASTELAVGHVSCIVDGFYRYDQGESIVCER